MRHPVLKNEGKHGDVLIHNKYYQMYLHIILLLDYQYTIIDLPEISKVKKYIYFHERFYVWDILIILSLSLV